MNHVYRSIWNDEVGTFVAASELSRASRGGAGSGSASTSTSDASMPDAHSGLKALAIAVMMALGVAANAQPLGGVVTAGGAGISAVAGNTTVTQSSQNVAINWQSFNIAAGQSVVFVQPNSSSVALNRVVGNDASSILGTLSANGKVFLVNPNGILFGKGASVNVGGLVASTLNISDSDFMAGKYRFSGDSTASVLNQGTININADGGYVALLGANVGNDGVMTARLGTVALAAGNAVTLDLAGDGLLNVTVDQGALNALAQNGGLIQADGGQVLLTARGAGNLLQSAVNNSGVIQAQSIDNRHGTIRLLGDTQAGTVSVSGTLDATGKATGQSGGDVAITGHHVGLFGQANIDASGDTGGGTVRVGGDLHGTTATLGNAAATYMSADATIAADAITNGAGGTVVLWSNDSTRAYGSISARAGAQGGDGGMIETSGHWLDVAGITVNASAPNGAHGTWLLDPADVTISAATSNGTFAGGNPDVFAPDIGVSTATVSGATIVATLNTGTDVTITTTNTGGGGNGDISVGTALTWTPLPITPATLTLDAVRDVNVNAAVTATNGSFVTLAGRDVNVNAAVSTTNGSFTSTAVNNVNVNAAITTVTGGYTANAGNNITIAAAITTTTGDVLLRADNDGTGPGAAGGTVIFTAPGTVSLNAGVASIYYNPVSYTAPTDYSVFFTGAGAVNSYMWVFAQGDNKVYDGLRTATISLKGNPVVTFNTVNPLFDTKDVGNAKSITFDSYTLSNPAFALFAPFGPLIGAGTTTANITPAPLTVTASNASKTYGQTPVLSAFSQVGLVNGETIGSVTETSPGTIATASVLGSPYAITPSAATGGTFSASNYTISYVNGALTINPASLTVTASDVTKTYGQSPTLSGFSQAGLVNGETIGSVTETSPGQVATASVLGSPYAITPSAATGGTFTASNYTISYVNGALTVNPANLTVTAANVTKIYGQNPTLSGFTQAGLVNGETIGSVTETSPGKIPTASVAGSPYAITPSAATGGTFTASNYIITYVNGVLTVTPANLTVTAANVTKNYGQTPTLSAFTQTGLVNGETIGSVTETSPGQVASAGVAGSPYAITPSAATGGTFVPSNYVTTYVPGLLTVNTIPLTVTASDATKTYGQTPTLTAFTTTGLTNGDTVGSVTETSPGTAATASVVGSPYAITPSNASGGSFTPTNYTIVYNNGVLTVIPQVPTTPVGVLPGAPGGPPVPGEMLGVVPEITLIGVPPALTDVTLVEPPAGLLTVSPPVAPAIVVVQPPVEPPAVVPEPPKVYVAPVHVRKQDRN